MIACLLLLQAASPTVGDTIWIRRTVVAPPGRAVRPAVWRPTGDIEVLGRPRLSVRGDSVEVAYPVTAWAPGTHAVQVPGPLLVGGDGQLDSLPAAALTITVGSVLPPGPRDTLRPQPATPTVATHGRTLLPLVALWALAGLLLGLVHGWWRRRGRAAPVPIRGPARPSEPPVERWAEAGESRAVVGAAVARLRDAIAAAVPDAGVELDTEACLAVLAERRPQWPLAELREQLTTLDQARFAQGADIDALAMHQSSADLERRLRAAA